MGEYYWSLPDENGHYMSLAEFNKEDGEVPVRIENVREITEFDEYENDEAYSQILREIYDPNEKRERERGRKRRKC